MTKTKKNKRGELITDTELLTALKKLASNKNPLIKPWKIKKIKVLYALAYPTQHAPAKSHRSSSLEP